MGPTAVTELQNKLFKRMGLDVPERQQPRQHKGSRGPVSGPQSRKLERKNQRAHRKTDRYSGRSASGGYTHTPARQGQRGQGKKATDERALPKRVLPPPKAREAVAVAVESEEDDDDEDETEEELELDDADSEDEDEEELDESDGRSRDEDEDEDDDDDEPSGAGKLSKSTREKLAEDDAEIHELERKLGIARKSKKLPQAFKDDGLDELIGDLGGDLSDEDGGYEEGLKRKRDYDDWLAAKRRKTTTTTSSATRQQRRDEDDDGESTEGSEDLEEDDDDDDDAFEGFGSDNEGEEALPKRVKENPYKAPTTGPVVAKYVPPSLRKAQGPESEAKSRLQKQLQGQINRLTEANILSIVQAIEELYQNNARGDVTELLTAIILAQMQTPDSLSDPFFVLTGGFSAAIYKVVGSSFGSHLVREVARSFGQVYETCHKEENDPTAIRKEASNMIAFLSQLYLFDVVGCRIIFDYMERFLENLSELNVELLLRVCRVAGHSLRRDDANALKHVTAILGTAVAKVGYANVSARTKFMIETLNDLKNSKTKARGVDSAVVSDHVLRMRKRLGELKARSRRLDGLAAMGVGLADIEQADTAGKWWLVGASVPAKESANKKDKKEKKDPSSSSSSTGANIAKHASRNRDDDSTNDDDDEDMDFVLPDYPKKARDQGLTTTAQIAIFTALMSAMDFDHAHQRFLALNLKRDDQLQIARVLVQCVGSETLYNPYYALVAQKAASSNPKIRFAFQDRLWKIFRSLGESLFGDAAEPDAEETADSERMKDERRIQHVAGFYAALVSDGALGIGVLKPLNMPEMNKWTARFVGWFVVGLLRRCRACKGPARDGMVHKVFGPAAGIPSLSAGLAWFLGGKLRRMKVMTEEEAKKLDKVVKKARAAVRGDHSTRDS